MKQFKKYSLSYNNVNFIFLTLTFYIIENNCSYVHHIYNNK